MSRANTAVAMVPKGETGKVIPIVRPTISHLVAMIEGITPLLQNPKTADYLQAIENPGDAAPSNKVKNPDKEYKDRLRASKGLYLHPVEAFTGRKGVFQSAAKVARLRKINSKIVMTGIKIEHDLLSEFADGIRPYIVINSKSGPVNDKHIAEIEKMGRHIPIPIYRPRFDDWSMELRISYWPSLVSLSNLMSLLATAGEIGIGSYRPENGGTFGTFKVSSAREVPKF
jgi:hypothetical protein